MIEQEKPAIDKPKNPQISLPSIKSREITIFKPEKKATINDLFNDFIDGLVRNSYPDLIEEESLSPKQKLKKGVRREFYHRKQLISEKITGALTAFGAPNPEIKGIENLREAMKITGGKNLFFFLNHLSNIDTPAFERSLKRAGFAEIIPKIIYLQGIKLNKNPLMSVFFLWAFNRIKVWPTSLDPINEDEKQKRKTMTRESLESAKKALQEGHILGVYAEGGRSYSAELKDAEPGVVSFLTLLPNSIVVPVAIYGTEKVLPPRGRFPWPVARVTFNFGNPIKIAPLIEKHKDLRNQEKRKKIADTIMENIAHLLPEKYRGVYSDKN